MINQTKQHYGPHEGKKWGRLPDRIFTPICARTVKNPATKENTYLEQQKKDVTIDEYVNLLRHAGITLNPPRPYLSPQDFSKDSAGFEAEARRFSLPIDEKGLATLVVYAFNPKPQEQKQAYAVEIRYERGQPMPEWQRPTTGRFYVKNETTTHIIFEKALFPATVPEVKDAICELKTYARQLR